MNFYSRFPGDYARDTAHLSLMEHGVYSVLLDTYYSTEKPLPPDLESLCRICRAMTKEERAAVKSVVDQFFPTDGDGMRHNRRADIEIPAARVRIETARENGKKGGRPPNCENPAGNPVGFQRVTQLVTQRGAQRQSSPYPYPYTNQESPLPVSETGEYLGESFAWGKTA